MHSDGAEPIVLLEEAVKRAARQLIAALATSAPTNRRDLMNIDTPIDAKLKSERVQLASAGWRELPGPIWESAYTFASTSAAQSFLTQAQALVSANGWPMGLSLEESGILRARLNPGPHGLTGRHIQAAHALNRLYGR